MGAAVVELGYEAVLAPDAVGLDLELADAHLDVQLGEGEPVFAEVREEALLEAAAQPAWGVLCFLDRRSEGSGAAVALVRSNEAAKRGEGCGVLEERFAEGPLEGLWIG